MYALQNADSVAPAAAGPVYHARRLTLDAEDHAASLSAWEQRYEQLSGGRFEGHLEDLRIGPVQIFGERANQSVLQGGRPRADTVTIGLTLGAREPGWYCGHRLGDRQAFAMASDREFELVAEAGVTFLAVCVDTAALLERAAIVRGRDEELRLPAPSVLRKSAAECDELGALLGNAMSMARERPGLLEDPRVRTGLVESLTDAVLDCIAPGQFETSLLPGAAARRHIVVRARDYMRNHADEAITVPDLCVATGASRRALQYAFEDVVNLSPVTYLRVMRLNHVRSELQSRRHDTVGDIAARWGFWHPSRFAAEYKQLFGELPSMTRMRFASSHRADVSPRH
ncbi:helix-turn-helix domain-containing protein [Variovorax sp. J22R133]|uniref:helix-turn-helix domain-containing protein n=1 Tax=Variovorax brevis TaxID=3053503 RepID=UPI0025750CD7|nr:helix-turn-helix domain-containing protein [Variovorax sp. J22R133]MDM0112902.1 helix-turn-helix domain-containing protein [Variovorax sp. J22R133]